MTDVVPIKVQILLKRVRGEVRHDYPDWTTLPLEAVDGEDHSDHQIVKWLYDKVSGHEDDDVDSPKGQQFGVMCVTRKFASQAMAAFPGRITVLTEAELQDFWDNRAMIRLRDLRRDVDALQGLKVERDLQIDVGGDVTALDVTIRDALDPLKDERGIRKDPRRRWADFKAKSGLNVVGIR